MKNYILNVVYFAAAKGIILISPPAFARGAEIAEGIFYKLFKESVPAQ